MYVHIIEITHLNIGVMDYFLIIYVQIRYENLLFLCIYDYQF